MSESGGSVFGEGGQSGEVGGWWSWMWMFVLKRGEKKGDARRARQKIERGRLEERARQ